MGQSRRLGLGAPLTQPPGEAPLTHPAEEQHSDSDDDAEEEPAAGPPPAPAPQPAAARETPAAPQPAAARETPAAPQPAAAREAPAALRHPPAARETATAAPTAPVVRYQPGPTPVQPQPHAQVVLPPADPPGVERVPPAVAATFQASYHTDISRVPVFRGPEAATEARSRNTRAFSRGGAVFLPADEGPLDSPRARPLLGHELVHVVQQRTLGAALPHPHTPHGQALEAQARAGEGVLSAGAGPAAGPAELMHSPALDPSRYIGKLAEELLRQGLAHHDGAGHLVLGSGEALDSVDSSAAVTQHFGEEQLLQVKLQILSDLNHDRYNRIEDLRDNFAIGVHEAELEIWKHASKEELTDPVWLKNRRVEAMNTAVRWRTDGKTGFTDEDISRKEEREFDAAVRLFNELEGDGSGYGSLPKIPQIIGLTWREAEIQLQPLLKKLRNPITRRYRESTSEKDIVIGVSPGEGKTYLEETQVIVTISSGRSRDAAFSDAATSTLQTATAMLGLKWKDEYAQNVRQQFGVFQRDEKTEKPASETSEKSGKKSAGKTSAPPRKDAEKQTGTSPGTSPAATGSPGTSSAAPTTPATTTPATPAASTLPVLPTGSAGVVEGDGAAGAASGAAAAEKPARPSAAAAKMPSASDEHPLRMPQIVGMTLEEAKRVLQQAGITHYKITERPSAKAEKDIVIEAPPEKTFLGTKKSPIYPSIIVSSGHSYGALAAEAGMELAGTLDALTGLKVFGKKRKQIRQAFGVFESPGEWVDPARSEAGQDALDLDSGTEPAATGTAAVTTTGTATGTAAVTAATTALTTAVASAPQAGKQQIATDALNLDELADRLYSRLRSRLAAELRNDRARAGMLSDYR
ncbi:MULTISPECIES: DUF4157 domain-containing protein [unclassified Streptomyces]|uniref:eCIS core domain-containing protein n=1 Tax=unclassified Streptomyces TaxID=2593676 RepID=UPI00386D25BE|nr:PASTA domain-containing protein [Streptomyces sp. NBC_01017]WSV34851.1 PASTA domain-containing protein [Streptomyces sp. NBC_01017]